MVWRMTEGTERRVDRHISEDHSWLQVRREDSSARPNDSRILQQDLHDSDACCSRFIVRCRNERSNSKRRRISVRPGVIEGLSGRVSGTGGTRGSAEVDRGLFLACGHAARAVTPTMTAGGRSLHLACSHARILELLTARLSRRAFLSADRADGNPRKLAIIKNHQIIYVVLICAGYAYVVFWFGYAIHAAIGER